MTITKQRVIMQCIRSTINEATFSEGLDAIRVGTHVLTIPCWDWQDMGSPETVTVTIEPGDLLNDDPISR